MIRAYHIPADHNLPMKMVELGDFNDYLRYTNSSFIELKQSYDGSFSFYLDEEGKLKDSGVRNKRAEVIENLSSYGLLHPEKELTKNPGLVTLSADMLSRKAPISWLVGDVIAVGPINDEGSDTSLPEEIKARIDEAIEYIWSR